MGINYASTGCGRVSRHISFSDKANKNSVGRLLEYGVRAVQTYTTLDSTPQIVMTNQITSMSKRQYRIPFLAYVHGTVKTQSGVGVESVTVTYCHIDRTTGHSDAKPGLCPLVSFTTNLLGEWSGQILVSDVNWTNTIENFYVQAFYNQTLSNNRFIIHSFQPLSQTVAITHLSNQFNSIIDTTTISILGSVKFDPLNMVGGSYNCPFANVPVVLVQGNGQLINTTSDSTGNFSFSVTLSDSVSIYLPYHNGNTWRSTMSVAGVTTPDLTTPATIYSYTDNLSLIAAVYDFTFESVTNDGNCWVRVLAKVNNIITTNAGDTVLNGLFQQFGTGNIKYIVNGATYNYYKRLTNKVSFNFYTNFATTWTNQSNVFNKDFKIYSTYNDLLLNEKSWQYCSFNVPNIGYPGNCGPNGPVMNMWSGFNSSVSKDTLIQSSEIWIQLLPEATSRRLGATADTTRYIPPPSKVPSVVPTIIPTISKSPTVAPTKIPSKIPSTFPSNIPTMPTREPTTSIPSKTPSRKPTTLPTKVPSVVPSMPSNAPSKVPSISPSKTPITKAPSKTPSRNPITYRPSVTKGCTSIIDFSGSATSNVISGNSNCRSFTFPKTSKQVQICTYLIDSPNTATYLWQVGYFNTLYPGGLGLGDCPYHDICPSHMMQMNVSSIWSFNDHRYNMISTPTSVVDGAGTYSIYGSNIAGVKGFDLLYSNQALNTFLPLPGVQTYTFLSFVADSPSSTQSSGILLQKLQVAAPCSPSVAPSVVPSRSPSLKPLTFIPLKPTLTPVIAPSIIPTYVPTSPTCTPSATPSAPTYTPTSTELNVYELSSKVSFSSRPILMHQFQFTKSKSKSISASCHQYIFDTIENATADVCNGVEITNGQAVFFPSQTYKAPYIQVNNIAEMSQVNAFSIATWVTLGSNTYDGSYPLFSFGDISFPDINTYSNTSSVSPYEPLGCYSTQATLVEMTVWKSNDVLTLENCSAYANNNGYSYFAFGPTLCRFVVLFLNLIIM